VIDQEQSDHEMANRRVSSEKLLEILNYGVINTFLMTDEAHHLSGCEQNYCYWAPKNTQELHQRPLHSERLSVVGSHLLEFLTLIFFIFLLFFKYSWNRAS
jgi:hypothetical protein